MIQTEMMLRKTVPSAFAINSHEGTSERYTHIPTYEVVKALQSEGWVATKAYQSTSRIPGNRDFAKHMIRFRQEKHINAPAIVGDSVPEIVLVNSHDGKSSYQLNAGVFRFVCSNGMVVPDSVISNQRIRHSGDIVNDVIEGVYEIADHLPKVSDSIQTFRNIELQPFEQEIFAKSASLVRWDEDKTSPTAGQLNTSRRAGDNGNDLWSTFNRVQENILKGGLSTISVNDGKVKHGRTRAIKSVTEDVKLNKALWTLAEEMAVIKGV